MKTLVKPVAATLLAAFLALPAMAQEIAAPDLDTLPAADVWFLGEVHDNAAHHLGQARAVAALAPKALVFEMVGPEPGDLPAFDDAAALADALNWGEGWPDFALYHPIFLAAPDARIYGAEVPRERARRAFSEGAAAVFGPEAGRYGLDTPLAPGDQAARVEEQFAAHCGAMPREMMTGMVEAQRLRDASLAEAAARAYAETGGPVAVITGNGHARRDHGAPALLAGAAPELRILTLGQIERGGEAPEAPPYDLWLLTEPAPREDPCAGLKG
ncbi:ChaN family lipoprotein [Pseudogemmobacter humi]